MKREDLSQQFDILLTIWGEKWMSNDFLKILYFCYIMQFAGSEERLKIVNSSSFSIIPY